MGSNGWIKLHRQMLKWEWYSDVPMKVLFLHFLLSANNEDTRWKGELVLRGQVIVGREKLAAETGLTEQQIRTAIKKLKSTGEITSKPTNKFSLITVCNYSKYQDRPKEGNQQINQQINQQSTSNQPTDSQQVTTIKEVKNERSKEAKEDARDTGKDDFLKEMIALAKINIGPMAVNPTLLHKFGKWFDEGRGRDVIENAFLSISIIPYRNRIGTLIAKVENPFQKAGSKSVSLTGDGPKQSQGDAVLQEMIRRIPANEETTGVDARGNPCGRPETVPFQIEILPVRREYPEDGN